MDWPLSGNGERVGEFARNRPVTLAEFARTNRFELINVPADGACQIYALMLGMWNATTNGEWGGARLQEADEAAEDKARQREVSAGVREEVIAYVAAKYEQRNDMPLVQLLSTVGDDASYARNKVRLTALQTAIVAINDGVEPDAATIDDAYETYRRQGTYTGPECAMAMAAKFKRRIYLFNPDRYGTRAEVVGYIPTLVDDEVVAVDPVIRPLHDGRMDPDPDAICVAFVNMVGDPNNYAGHYYWLCPHDAYHAD